MRVLVLPVAALVLLCFCVTCPAVSLRTALLPPLATARTTSLSQLQTLVNIFASCATPIALLAGAIWSYFTFVRKRQKYPRAALSHRVTHRYVGLGKVLLHVDVEVRNAGDVLVSLVESTTWVQQVLPLPNRISENIRADQGPVKTGETQVLWDAVGCHERKWESGKCEIEPGDTQQINHDFILGDELRTVQVYTHVTNEAKRPRKIGWNLTTLYDLPAPESTPSDPRRT
jgi:hypothetical protein